MSGQQKGTAEDLVWKENAGRGREGMLLLEIEVRKLDDEDARMFLYINGLN